MARTNDLPVLFARIAPEKHHEVRIRAAIEGRTMSALVRAAIDAYLASPIDPDSAPSAGEPTE